jgi:gamma-glutamylcyclotransferase (GGCT)/AIG2-like uncharacterized protein YtfP
MGPDGLMRVFLYGTLLDHDLLARFTGRRVTARPAELPGWRRVGLRGARYPTLRRARGRTEGVVVQVNAAALRRLMAYEGARYRLKPVHPRCASRPVRACAWIADAPTRRPWP